MRISEGHSSFGQTINVWGFDLRMTFERADPIIQIVNRDEKIVRFVFLGFRDGGSCQATAMPAKEQA